MQKNTADPANCNPCLGDCKRGFICAHYQMAKKIIGSIQEGNGDTWSVEEIDWALTITGDIKMH